MKRIPEAGHAARRRRWLVALGASLGSVLSAPLRSIAAGVTAPIDAHPSAAPEASIAAPPLMLANSWRAGLALADYWVSEKYDGVRGYWDGVQLWSRRGNRISAPVWFTAGWPTEPLDGELWAGRGAFEVAQSTVAKTRPVDGAWRVMHFMAFDLPASPAPFEARKERLARLVETAGSGSLRLVAQHRPTTEQALRAEMARVVAEGGEGLMLHRAGSLYRADRSDDLVKLKPHEDAEAVVVQVVPGKGKYEGAMGALLVQTPEGVRFKLGAGFKDDDRHAPPAIGSLVTYRYRGVNKTGIPRFATFMRRA